MNNQNQYIPPSLKTDGILINPQKYDYGEEGILDRALPTL